MTGGACGKMKVRICILAVSTLVIATTAFCACAPGEEYLPVTVEELTDNFTAYRGQNVEVTGEFVGNLDGWFGPPPRLLEELAPCSNYSEVRALDKYYPCYFEEWGIASSNQKRPRDAQDVVAFTPNGSRENFPDFEEGQQITIRGKAHVTGVEFPYCKPQPCCIEIRSCLYIKVRPENVKIIPGQ